MTAGGIERDVGRRVVPTPAEGLTESQVRDRARAGLTNAVESNTSRPVAQIVRANVFTVFNGLLTTLFVIIAATGRWQNGLFGLVIVANSVIGIVQEVRARRILDRLAVLSTPTARVIRGGDIAAVDVGAVVVDDLLEVSPGDQVPADGVVRASKGLEIDESLLTGESDPVAKEQGDLVRSGSIVVAGWGRFQATTVGAGSYSARLTADARRYSVTHSELVAGHRLLRWISLMMLAVGPFLLWSQFRSSDNPGWQEAVTGTVAALVGMVPEGLVLLTTVAFMLAVITLARRQTLVQELPAVEGLARVDVVCLDKTGTLTHGDIVFDRMNLLGGVPEADAREALALLAVGPDANATAAALAAEFVPSAGWRRTGAIAFSSARKWSAVTTDEHGTWVLGAPEIVLPQPASQTQAEARAAADELAAQGHRGPRVMRRCRRR